MFDLSFFIVSESYNAVHFPSRVDLLGKQGYQGLDSSPIKSLRS